jgi:hypothetical protein
MVEVNGGIKLVGHFQSNTRLQLTEKSPHLSVNLVPHRHAPFFINIQG